MSKYTSQEQLRIKRLLNWYNMIPNVTWSVINLAPICIYCYNHVDRGPLYIFIAVSVLPAFLPNSFYDRIQIGKHSRTYKRLGVGFVNKLAQNGAIINRIIKKKFPAYKMIIHQRSSINKVLQQTYMFEKFHFIMFVFFVLVTFYTLVKGQFWWAMILTITNILYNVYPNLLQQYIRLKLRSYKNVKPH